jgi:hypothetical protein
MPQVLYGRDACSITLWGEHRPTIFENRVLRRIIGFNMEKETGIWRKLFQDEFLFYIPSQMLLG